MDFSLNGAEIVTLVFQIGGMLTAAVLVVWRIGRHMGKGEEKLDHAVLVMQRGFDKNGKEHTRIFDAQAEQQERCAQHGERISALEGRHHR